jgi:hypothetical protein
MNQNWSWVLFDICLQTLFLVDKKFLTVTAHRIIWIKSLKIDFFLKPMKSHRNHVWNMFVVICLWSIKFCGLGKTDTLLLSISSVDKWNKVCKQMSNKTHDQFWFIDLIYIWEDIFNIFPQSPILIYLL